MIAKSEDKDKATKTHEIKRKPLERLTSYISYPDLDKEGKALDTRNNLKHLLELYGATVSYNAMTRKREVRIPGVSNLIEEQENASLADVYHLATINGMPNKRLDKHLDSLAWGNDYHPIAQCILNKPWDGNPRLDEFIGTIKTANFELAKIIFTRWMLSAIAAIFSPDGFASQGVLVLQGNQNLGKTRFVKSLDPANCNAVKEGAFLDPSNKDSVINLAQYWIVELGELDGTFRKADIARLKSHITSQVDNVRQPYKEKSSCLLRRTVYVATVNDSRFLVDDTGNRRWWTIAVEGIDFNHDLDMQQVWAEVHHLWVNGALPWLKEDEAKQINESNVNHEQLDPFEEKVLEYFDWDDGWRKNNTLALSATQVIEAINFKNPKISDINRMGKILTKLTGVKSELKGRCRVHILPRRCTPIHTS